MCLDNFQQQENGYEMIQKLALNRTCKTLLMVSSSDLKTYKIYFVTLRQMWKIFTNEYTINLERPLITQED